MKVILLQDVKSLGKKGEIVNVNDGYARNFILPKKLGLEANGKNMNILSFRRIMKQRLQKSILKLQKSLQNSWKPAKLKLQLKLEKVEKYSVLSQIKRLQQR